jgi:hypothetical protein
MYCVKCGQKLASDANFCQKCGEKVSYRQEVTGEPVRSNQNIGCAISAIVLMVLFGVVILIAIVLIAIEQEMGSANTYKGTNHVIDGLRPYHTILKGGNKDQVTVMVYMIGSDLESQEGLASKDINEMLKADLGDNVKLVLQTGGTKEWENPLIKGGTTQRFEVVDGELIECEDLGLISMVEPDTLADFVSWASKKRPANRYALVFWNHGGGTVLGYGYDEYFEEDMLELSEIAKALEEAKVLFDFVGFDACLMGTIETAFMLEPYADYLIASEEIVPGFGWYYTNWLTLLGKSSSIKTVELGVQLIDDFVDGLVFIDEECSLAIIDLREIPYAYEQLCNYLEQTQNLLLEGQFPKVSEARANTKSYGEGLYEQIDIIDYSNRIQGIDNSDLKQAISSAVKYNKSSIPSAHGLAMYYPYKYPEYYEQALNDMMEYGYGHEQYSFFLELMNILVGGQYRSGFSQYTRYGWYSMSIQKKYTDLYGRNEVLKKELVDKGDYWALPMTEEEWELMNAIELQVLIDDGEGYIDLGFDNIYTFDEVGDLVVEFDYTWITIDGETVPFYAQEESGEDEEWYSYGYVPASLNGEENIEILIYWDAQNPLGYVKGYRYMRTGFSVPQRGLKTFKETDTIDYIFAYYNYDETLDGYFTWGNPIVIGESDLIVSYEDIGDYVVEVCFRLTDIYNNHYWTESLIYE